MPGRLGHLTKPRPFTRGGAGPTHVVLALAGLPQAPAGGAAPPSRPVAAAARRRVAGRRRAARLGLGLGLRGGGGGLGPGAAVAVAVVAAGPGAGPKMAAAAATATAVGPGAGSAAVAGPGGAGPCTTVSVFPGARLLTIGDANGEIQRHAEQQALRLEVRAGPDAAGIALYSRECWGHPGDGGARGRQRGRRGRGRSWGTRAKPVHAALSAGGRDGREGVRGDRGARRGARETLGGLRFAAGGAWQEVGPQGFRGMIGSDCRVLERVWFVDLILGDILYTCTGHLKSGFQCGAS